MLYWREIGRRCHRVVIEGQSSKCQRNRPLTSNLALGHTTLKQRIPSTDNSFGLISSRRINWYKKSKLIPGDIFRGKITLGNCWWWDKFRWQSLQNTSRNRTNKFMSIFIRDFYCYRNHSEVSWTLYSGMWAFVFESFSFSLARSVGEAVHMICEAIGADIQIFSDYWKLLVAREGLWNHERIALKLIPLRLLNPLI